MKRLTIIAALLMMAMPLMAERVTPETARKVATTFLNNNGAKAAQLTDLSKSAGFSNLYIFTADEGFVVMSADDCVKPILGYSLTNKFVAEGMPENISSWLQGYSDEIQLAIDNQAKASSDISKQWNDLAEGKQNVAKSTAIVGPLIQTTWDQSPYYNNLCPYDSTDHMRTVTGCVATAMAQIMNYWNYPSHGIGSHSYIPKNHPKHGIQHANFGETFYDWDNMPVSLSSSSTTAQKNAVATLMYHCGVSVDMDYDYSQPNTSHTGSSTSTEQAALALKTYFNYSSSIEYKEKSYYSDTIWINMLKVELNANRPLQYRGKNPNSSGGHSFICDGYDSENNFNFNWGWNGNCNGFFSLNELKPDDSHNYTSGQAAIFGIQPIDCSASEPTNLTLTANGHNITLNWIAANNASCYNIYCNNTLIGNFTATTYSTTASYGINAYYVRSLDANNTLSLSSNYATVTIDYQTPIANDLTTSITDNSVSLSWTNPDWCYPSSPSDTMTYGEGDFYYFWPSYYYAHRYLATDLNKYANKLIFKVATYIYFPGTYTVYIYTNTSNNQPDENSLSATKSITATGTTEWLEFTFDNPIILSGTTDLWIVIKPENIEDTYPIPSFRPSVYNENACYVSTSSPTSLSSIHYIQNIEFIISWYIKAYLTDGTYTYNLYDNGTRIAQNIEDTIYTVENPTTNAIHNYTVKTNYYAGESAASNTASLALGSNTLDSLTLANNDNITIGNGSSLTVNGMLYNTNPDNLVLEDGAQLYTESENVHATVKKSIAGYGDNNAVKTGWNFIASPIVVVEGIEPTAVDSLIGNAIPETNPVVYDYDLYRLSPSDTMWENYHKHNDFRLVNGQGYLYAKSSSTTLKFSGIIKPFSTAGNANQVPLVDGWNLIGNPYTFNVYSNKSYYKITTETIDGISKNVITAVTNSGEAIAPCSGIVVKSNGTDTVTFNTSANQWANSNNGSIQMILAQTVTTRSGINKETLDNAIVSFNEGCQLEKFYFGDNDASIYIPKEGEEYAIQCAESQGEMPLNFRAAEDGSFTLTINPEGVEMNYLHLIDNMTGSDVDLLTNPSYTFKAKTTDYESRFKLVFASGSVFADGASTGSASFAFFNNGQWIINNNGESTVQVLDMTGRILRSERVSGGCDIQINYAPGVYVLRLINGEKVRTQKIVIE